MRIIISVLLALVVWGFISWETNPEVERTIPDVPVEARNVPENMQLVGELPTVAVTLKGPEDVMAGLSNTEISAYVNLEDVQSVGVTEQQVEVAAPSGLRVATADPSTISVELDAVITETFPIQLVETAPRPPNVASVTVSPEAAEVRGSRQEVSRVDRVIAEVTIGAETESFTKQVPTKAVTSDGTVVSDVTIEPAQATVDVTFSTTGKFVPITVMCACVQNNEVSVVTFPEAAAIPSTVRITGPENLVSEITEIRTKPIDITNLTESDWVLDVELDLTGIPNGVTVTETKVDVWVPIEQERLIFDNVPIEVVNLADGLQATVTPGRVTFAVRGSSEELQQLEGTTPLAIVDAKDREAGSYRVTVRVVVPPELTYEGVEPAEVQLTITPETGNQARPEPTPVPNP